MMTFKAAVLDREKELKRTLTKRETEQVREKFEQFKSFT